MKIEKLFKKSLFIFRRDLRVEDNTGLIFALHSSEKVIPAFIFTPEQVGKNPYKSEHCIKFMVESLHDLEGQLSVKEGKLFVFHGGAEEIVSRCIRELEIDALIVNRDYTPYSIQRDKRLEKVCKENGVAFYSFDDALLHPPERTLKKDGTPYTVFTPYFRNASKYEVAPSVKNRATNYFLGTISFAEKLKNFKLPEVESHLVGGRKEALKILKHLDSYEHYGEFRDFPAIKCFTSLSPYMKFTVISPREVYEAVCNQLGEDHDLIRSLYWRDFFSTIAFFFPYVFKGSFHQKYDKVKWSHSETSFKRWCEGATGFPIVDAGMRELNATGFMHNRVRMITASFLVKDLHIDWRKGERYFAQHLIDYDPSVNNGNWQWVASTGCDAQPYFRIFNPWNQQKKFDPDCVYIKKWVPELKDVSPKMLHNWFEEKYRDESILYPAPMINHQKAAKEALSAYKLV